MGTDCGLFLKGRPRPEALRAMAEAQWEVRRLETIFSRFDPDSELSELNRRGAVRAGPELLEVVDLALAARHRTSGRFDPTVHDALVAAGYDRTFEEVASAEGRGGSPRVFAAVRCAGSVRVDRGTRNIELDPGVRLDLGGIAKGYAVDRAAKILGELGPCLVDAGGDIAARGGGWPIGLDTGDGTLTLELGDGAVATSGRDRRHWTRGNEELHHIIDPATGLPAAGDLLRVTAVAATATEAEVRAKALFLAGAQEAEREANATATPALLVTLDGRTLFAGGLA
jgi:thiamine biosynthesis lipoprotein